MALFSFISRLDKKERRFEMISLVLLAVLLVLTPIIYSIVPEKILILTQDTGALDSYNNKSALWLFPLIGVVIYAAISIQKHYLIKYREAPAPRRRARAYHHRMGATLSKNDSHGRPHHQRAGSMGSRRQRQPRSYGRLSAGGANRSCALYRRF